MKQRGKWRNTAAVLIAVLILCIAAECFLAGQDRFAPYRVREETVWSETAGRGVLRGNFRMRLDETIADEARVFYAIPLGGDRKPRRGAEDIVFYLPRYGEGGDTIYDDVASLRKYVETDGSSFCSFRILRGPDCYPDRVALSAAVTRIREWLTKEHHLAAGGNCYLIGAGVGADVIAELCAEHAAWVRAAFVVRRRGEDSAGLLRLASPTPVMLIVRERRARDRRWPPSRNGKVILLETEQDLLFAPVEHLAYRFWHWVRDCGAADEALFHRAVEEFPGR